MSSRYPGVYKRGPYYYWCWQDKLYTHGKQIHHGKKYRTPGAANKARRAYIREAEGRGPINEEYENWTVRDLCQWFITQHDEPNNRKTTVTKTRSICKCHIIPAIGNIKMFELTNQDILRFKNDYILHETEATAYSTFQILKRIYSRAVKEGLIQISPFKTGLPPGPQAEHPTISPEILRDMLLELEGVDRAIIATAGMQGRRNGEIGGLQWNDLDFDALEMHIRRQWVKGEIVFHLKSRKGKKELVVPMTALYIRIIKKWKLECVPGDWIFPSSRYPQKPMSINNWVNKKWRAIRKQYGLPDGLRLHDLRHSFVTILIASGVSLSIIKKILGHASIKTTEDTYGHLEIKHLRDSLAIFEKLFDIPKDKKGTRGG